ncbi:Hypothetical predicted protein, partial [Paramuricea clavata]
SSNTTTTINRNDSDASEGKANEQEMCSHKQNEGDYIMNCKDCSKLSVEVAEIKLDLALLFLKVNTAEVPATCECNRLRSENQLLKQEIKLLKETLHGMELSKSRISIAIDNMNNQPTITDNDSVVLIDIEESEVNVNTNMNNLPSATDNEKRYNTRGPVVNDSLTKYRNPNKPVVQDSLTSFDHLLKEKAALNANMHRHKRNQMQNSPTNTTHFSKPNYRRNQAALNANMDRHKRNPMHNSSTNRTHFSKPNYRRNQFSEPKHQYRQANFPSKIFSKRSLSKDSETKNNSRQYRYKSKSNQPGIQSESFPIKVRVTAWRNGVLGSLPTAGQSHLGPVWNPRLGAIQRTSDNYTSQRSVNFNNLINIKTNTNPTIGKSSVPSFLLSNVCHITNKVDELAAVVSIYDPSVVMITESWLSDDIGDSSVKIGNKYNIFRRDRKSPGGGVIAYVNNCLPAERMTHLEEENKEPIKRQKTPVTSKKIRLMKRANLNDLSLNMASEDWTAVYSALDVDEKVSAYNSIIIKMLDEFLPEKNHQNTSL